MMTHTHPSSPSKHVKSHAIEIDPHSRESLGYERLVFFSDAVFAIAITLLALDIRLPSGREVLTNRDLLRALLDLQSNYLAFMISFLVIGSTWVRHHQRFSIFRQYNTRLIWLNLFLLMGVAFMPFPTAVLAEYGNRTATIFYALTISAIGLTQLLIWWYAASGNRLLDPTTTTKQIRHEMLSSLATPAVFILSIGVAFFNDNLARLSWLLLIPVMILLRNLTPRA